MKAGLQKAWFPAKRYGWGWDLPTVWQGWVVLLSYLVLLVVSALFIDPAIHMNIWLATVWGLSAILILVCWWKGERPSWRWGDK